MPADAMAGEIAVPVVELCGTTVVIEDAALGVVDSVVAFVVAAGVSCVSVVTCVLVAAGFMCVDVVIDGVVVDADDVVVVSVFAEVVTVFIGCVVVDSNSNVESSSSIVQPSGTHGRLLVKSWVDPHLNVDGIRVPVTAPIGSVSVQLSDGTHSPHSHGE